MRISVILAHPDKNSFNHAIAAITIETLKQNGHEVYFHDLYEEKFDPILPTEEIQNNPCWLLRSKLADNAKANPLSRTLNARNLILK